MSLKLYWNPKNPIHKIVPLSLVASGIAYEDVKLKDDAIFGGKVPPYIENNDGKVLDKTMAMAKFYAKRKNLMGKDDWELYCIEKGLSLIGKIVRILDNIVCKRTDRTLWDKDQEVYLKHIEKLIGENKSGFLVTKKPTLTDLYFLVMMHYLEMPMFSKTLEKHPNFVKVRDNILLVLPQVKEYLEPPKE